ncbi:hypothetical protein Bca52824_016652 [Brassica carinata]|uniref:BHLH domain-containing protein n=1 Tax=Brassica carinata TaxID=52824 RepID=A0A8X8B4A0_BRACI|nr:hypothetical protein Bca52824_016652 [Brassica carinata]
MSSWRYQRSLKIRNYSGVLTQEPGQFHNFVRPNDCGTVQEDEVVVNSSSSGGAVKQEQEHEDEECSRKRGRTGSCVRPGGTKACRERLRREKLNEKFMDLSSVLEPGRTPKTDKPNILDDAICILNQLKAEKNELREEKPALKAEKEKTEQQLKSMCSLKLLLELNRALRPGGFFVWSATAVYRKNEEDSGIWKAMSVLTKAMCWKLVIIKKDKLNEVGAAIYQKPTTNDCYNKRPQNDPPPCKDSDDQNAACL